MRSNNQSRGSRADRSRLCRPPRHALPRDFGQGLWECGDSLSRDCAWFDARSPRERHVVRRRIGRDAGLRRPRHRRNRAWRDSRRNLHHRHLLLQILTRVYPLARSRGEGCVFPHAAARLARGGVPPRESWLIRYEPFLVAGLFFFRRFCYFSFFWAGGRERFALYGTNQSFRYTLNNFVVQLILDMCMQSFLLSYLI